MQIKSTKGIGASNGVKMLIYGKAGHGKTFLCSTAPNPIIFSAEAGLLSLSRYDLPFVEIKSMNDLFDAYNWASTSNEAREYQTLCLDSLSEIGEVVLANAKAGVKDPRQAYGELIERMLEMIKKFRDLPGYHVYMSAKQEYITNQGTGISINGPMMPGAKLGQQLPYLFDEVFQLEIEQPVGEPSYRYLRTQPDMLNDAKDRSGVLDPMEEPNIIKVINKIVGMDAVTSLAA